MPSITLLFWVSLFNYKCTYVKYYHWLANSVHRFGSIHFIVHVWHVGVEGLKVRQWPISTLNLLPGSPSIYTDLVASISYKYKRSVHLLHFPFYFSCPRPSISPLIFQSSKILTSIWDYLDSLKFDKYLFTRCTFGKSKLLFCVKMLNLYCFLNLPI